MLPNKNLKAKKLNYLFIFYSFYFVKVSINMLIERFYKLMLEVLYIFRVERLYVLFFLTILIILQYKNLKTPSFMTQ